MIHANLLGSSIPPKVYEWDESDVLLYAVAVGAGQDDPSQELAFTTENTTGLELQVLPSFVGLLGGDWPELGDFDPAALVHAGHQFQLRAPLTTRGRVVVYGEISGVSDKGTGTLIVKSTKVCDAGNGQVLATIRNSVFVKGESSGHRPGATSGKKLDFPRPGRELVYATHKNQALIYRLTGDRNPLHSDPIFAQRGGLSEPILHGLCTVGFAARALLNHFCGSDTARFIHFETRFAAVVVPGDTLRIRMWGERPGLADFDMVVGDRQVLTAGRFEYQS